MKLKILGLFDPATETHVDAEYAAVWNDRQILKDHDYLVLKNMVKPENLRSNIFWHPLYSEIMGVAVTYGLEIGGVFHSPEEFK